MYPEIKKKPSLKLLHIHVSRGWRHVDKQFVVSDINVEH